MNQERIRKSQIFRFGINNYRWRICGLLFLVTTMNYLDRSVLSILAPQLQDKFGWSEVDYSFIVSAFELAYALSVIGMGKVVDKYGVRLIYPIAVLFWSIASAGHAFAKGIWGFALARFGLGIGESANFPSALKTVSEWFPREERATAIGVFNAGASIGAIISPIIVPWIALRYGWQWCFGITGVFGLIWIFLWQWTYRSPEKHKRVTQSELEIITSGRLPKEPVHSSISWWNIFRKKETLVICFVRFLSDPTWWFLLFWLPKFLNSNFGITLTDIGAPMVTIYLIADLGSIGWGWVSSKLIKRTGNPNYSRKLTMFICAILVIPIMIVSGTPHLYVAIALISLAAASHMGFVANVYAVISDVFPQEAVGTVTGISTAFAVLGGLVFSTAIGFILQTFNNYFLVFLIAGLTYLVAWAVLMIGIPKIRVIEI